MTGTLFLLGIGLLAAAFIGGGLKVSNVVEIPVISTRVGGIGLGAVGLLAIGLGYLTHEWDTQRPSASPPAATASPPAATATSGPTAQPSNATPATSTTAKSTTATPTDPTVLFSGSMTFDNSGLDLDLAPPRHVDDASIVNLTTGELYTSSAVRMAPWDQQQQPDKAACAKQLEQRGSVEVTGLTDGAIVCVRTVRGHIARLTVQATGPSGLVVDGIVWQS